MATILEEGTKHLTPICNPHKCYNCESLIQYDAGDMKDSFSSTGVYVECPVCGHTTNIKNLEKNSTTTVPIKVDIIKKIKQNEE